MVTYPLKGAGVDAEGAAPAAVGVDATMVGDVGDESSSYECTGDI